MAYDPTPKSGYRAILSAAAALNGALSQSQGKLPSPRQIVVRLRGTGAAEETGTPTTLERKGKILIFEIHAESQAHAEEHAADLVEQGCFCISTGEASVECDCSHL